MAGDTQAFLVRRNSVWAEPYHAGKKRGRPARKEELK